MFVCAGENEQFDFATSVGIGLIESSINLTKLCMESKPKALTFVGSAGSYGEKKLFDIVECRFATQIENSFFSNGAYTPIIVNTKIDNVSRETLVNSSNYITTDKSLWKYYIKEGIVLENMEYFAVVQVANHFNIPVNAILIVTNYCDSNAHKDFILNHKEAKDRLTRYIKGS